MLATTSSNPRYEQLKAYLAKQGLTEHGADWLLRALHPAITKGSPQGIPDGSSVSTAVADYVREVDVGAPDPTQPYDALIVSCNGDVPALFVATRSDPNSGWDFGDYYSWLSPGNVVAVLTNQGTYTDPASNGQIGVPVYDTTAVAPPFTRTAQTGVFPLWFSDTQPNAWRRASASITVENTSPPVEQSGTVTAGTFSAIRPVAPVGSVSGYSPNVDTAGDTLTSYSTSSGVPFVCAPVLMFANTRIPTEIAEMTNQNKGCYVGPAGQGVYVPTRLGSLEWVDPPEIQSVNTWGSVRGGSLNVPFLQGNHTAEGVTSVVSCFGARMVDQVFLSTDGVPADIVDPPNALYIANAFYGVNQTSSSHTLCVSAGVDDSQTTVIMFTRLSGASTLHVKSCVTLEIAPTPNSPCCPFVGLPKCADVRAMELYKTITATHEQAYPADANALGWILSGLFSAIKMAAPLILPPLMSWVSGKLLPQKQDEQAKQPEQSASAPALALKQANNQPKGRAVKVIAKRLTPPRRK